MHNPSIAILLVNKQVRAVRCAYELDKDGKEIPGKSEVFKTLDPALKVDDFVVIPTSTRVNMTVVKVVAVDVEVALESTCKMDWIVAGPISKAQYEATLAKEQQIIDTIVAAEKRHARDELAKKLLANVDPAAFQTLELVDMTNGAAPAAPTS